MAAYLAVSTADVVDESHAATIMKHSRLRHHLQQLPQELQDHILDLILQEDGRFQERIKHFTRDHAIPQQNPSAAVLKITEDYRSPVALQINRSIRRTFADAIYRQRTVRLEWNELSPWLASLATEHVDMLRQVQLNMYPELRQTRAEAKKYCDICFDMLLRDGVQVDMRLFSMLYFDIGSDGLGEAVKGATPGSNEYRLVMR